MGRMTRRAPDGTAYFKPMDPDCGSCNSCGRVLEHMMLITDRLAAYEDTGLEPERVAEFAQAEKDGRLAVLPCKVGDTVYRLFHAKNAEPVIVPTTVRTVGEAANLVGRIGKKSWLVGVYLTRQEAEEALREEAEHG